MAKDPASYRRRAAASALAGVLDTDALIQALWSLPPSLRGESVSEIIAFVDDLGGRFGLDAATCKRLYTEFFKALRTPEDSLPPDPWPAMQAARPPMAPSDAMGAVSSAAVPAIAAPMPAASPVARPVAAPSPVATMPAPVVGLGWQQASFAPATLSMTLGVAAVAPLAAGPATDWAAAGAGQAPPAGQQTAAAPPPADAGNESVGGAADAAGEGPSIVFGAVLRALVKELATAHREAMDEVRNDAMRALAGSRAGADLREQYGRAWDRALTHDWQLRGPVQDLSGLLQLTHGALVVAFGRIGADQIVGRAMAQAARLPEAQAFAPRQLMPA